MILPDRARVHSFIKLLEGEYAAEKSTLASRKTRSMVSDISRTTVRYGIRV